MMTVITLGEGIRIMEVVTDSGTQITLQTLVRVRDIVEVRVRDIVEVRVRDIVEDLALEDIVEDIVEDAINRIEKDIR